MARARTSPRKSPRQDRSKATVDAILAATARLLVRDGYDKTSTNRVALAAGVSIGSLYQYFPNKEAIVAALASRHMAETITVFESQLTALADAPMDVAVRAMVHSLLAAHAVDPALHKVLLEQVPRVGRLERVDELQKRSAAMLRAVLERRRDEIRPRDLDLAVFVLVRSVEALAHAAVIEQPESLRDDALANEIADLVLRYLAREHSRASR